MDVLAVRDGLFALRALRGRVYLKLHGYESMMAGGTRSVVGGFSCILNIDGSPNL